MPSINKKRGVCMQFPNFSAHQPHLGSSPLTPPASKRKLPKILPCKSHCPHAQKVGHLTKVEKKKQKDTFPSTNCDGAPRKPGTWRGGLGGRGHAKSPISRAPCKSTFYTPDAQTRCILDPGQNFPRPHHRIAQACFFAFHNHAPRHFAIAAFCF